MIASKRDTALRLAQEHHHRAMEHAERGEWPEALAQEVAAVGYYLPLDVEPSRSILCRSAACLAMKAGSPIAAFALADIGLDGSPPDCVREELEDVWDKAERSAFGELSRDKDQRIGSNIDFAVMSVISRAAHEFEHQLRSAYADKPRFRDRLPAWLRRMLCALKS